jgi:hypothetical protein
LVGGGGDTWYGGSLAAGEGHGEDLAARKDRGHGATVVVCLDYLLYI